MWIKKWQIWGKPSCQANLVSGFGKKVKHFLLRAAPPPTENGLYDTQVGGLKTKGGAVACQGMPGKVGSRGGSQLIWGVTSLPRKQTDHTHPTHKDTNSVERNCLKYFYQTHFFSMWAWVLLWDGESKGDLTNGNLSFNIVFTFLTLGDLASVLSWSKTYKSAGCQSLLAAA